MTMPSMANSLARKNASRERLAQKVITNPKLLPEVLACLAMDKPGPRYGASRILRILSKHAPALLYPRIQVFVDNLESNNAFLASDAIVILGNLTAVDTGRKVDRIFRRYFGPIRGPNLIVACNIVKGAVAMALARPRLTEDIVGELLRVEKATYATGECRNVALGQVIDALDQIFAQVQRERRVCNFVRRQLDNPRPAVRKKADRFLRRHARGKPGVRAAQ